MNNHYALVGEVSGELLTYQGKVIVHNNKGEMEFIFTGAKVIDCPDYVKEDEIIQIRDILDFGSYQWPLKKTDFRR